MVNLKPVISAAESGGEVLRRYFGKTLAQVEKSNAADIRTSADLDSEAAIIRSLKSSFPKYNVLSEEAGLLGNKSDYMFVIDPLDGSNNFVLGIPNFAVSIGLMRGNRIIAGVIYQPVIDEMYYAQAGQGAFLGNRRLHVSSEGDMARATISYTCGYINSARYEETLVRELHNKRVKRIIENWCPSHEFCLLAAGRIEAIVNNKNELYDCCAGKIIAKEAGARITTFDGKPERDEHSSTFLATNGTGIHGKMLKVIRSCRPERRHAPKRGNRNNL